jgi:hypothetical protein
MLSVLTRGEADALVAALGDQPVAGFADLSGQALPLALALWDRWRCAIGVALVDARGNWTDVASAGVDDYLQALAVHGIPADKCGRVISAAGLATYDLIGNLCGFGDRHRIGPLGRMLPQILGAASRILTDIRKGSGSYPVLNAFGSCTALSQHEAAGKPVTRALFQVNPALYARPADAAPDSVPDGWADIAATLTGPDGFYRSNALHSFLYIPRGKTLVVTFDNLDIAMNKREDRRPWGFGFIEKQGWSMLGVMANGWTWYRDTWVWDQFDDLAASGFFAGFDRVVFYGASMGGYAAAAFAPACPGADVVAISPQSTLDKRVVPWETRYKTAWSADFSGPYGDAALASRTAGRVIILYDPYEPLDAAHVARFAAPNVTRLRTPLLGHRLGSSLHQMGILQEVTLGALNGTLTEPDFYRLLRARRGFARYQRELFKRALAKGHPDLARRLARWVLTRGDNRYIRKALAAL